MFLSKFIKEGEKAYLTLEVAAVTQSAGIHRNIFTSFSVVYLTAALVLSKLWPDSYVAVL